MKRKDLIGGDMYYELGYDFRYFGIFTGAGEGCPEREQYHVVVGVSF